MRKQRKSKIVQNDSVNPDREVITMLDYAFAREIQDLVSWHCDNDALPENDFPEDQVAHINE